MHRLVTKNTGRSLRQIAVAEQGHGAEIGADGALLQPGREFENVSLRLELIDRKVVALLKSEWVSCGFQNR